MSSVRSTYLHYSTSTSEQSIFVILSEGTGAPEAAGHAAAEVEADVDCQTRSGSNAISGTRIGALAL